MHRESTWRNSQEGSIFRGAISDIWTLFLACAVQSAKTRGHRSGVTIRSPYFISFDSVKFEARYLQYHSINQGTAITISLSAAVKIVLFWRGARTGDDQESFVTRNLRLGFANNIVVAGSA